MPMFNPFEMLQGQGGAGMQDFGRQLGLNADQTRRAMEALLPAFALGLQRNDAADPAAFLRLFSSPMLNQAVLQQAAAASGVGSQALRQMLPAMAGMVVASLVHMLLNPPPVAAPGPAARPEPAQNPNPFAAGQAFWTELMTGFLPPAAGAPAPAAQKAAPAAAPAAPPPPPNPAAKPAPAAGRPIDVFQQMLLTSAEVQEENVKAMKDIFDAFWTEDKAAARAGRTGAGPVRPGEAAPGPADRTPKPASAATRKGTADGSARPAAGRGASRPRSDKPGGRA